MPESEAQKRISDKASKESVAGKLREKRRKKERTLQEIFDDNTTGRE